MCDPGPELVRSQSGGRGTGRQLWTGDGHIHTVGGGQTAGGGHIHTVGGEQTAVGGHIHTARSGHIHTAGDGHIHPSFGNELATSSNVDKNYRAIGTKHLSTNMDLVGQTYPMRFVKASKCSDHANQICQKFHGRETQP